MKLSIRNIVGGLQVLCVSDCAAGQNCVVTYNVKAGRFSGARGDCGNGVTNIEPDTARDVARRVLRGIGECAAPAMRAAA